VDYFFANQDSMRCVVQKDIDKPLIPLANGMVFLQMAIQQPAILCPTMISDIPAAINEYWLIDCRKISL
jgi:hypothetical protein